MSLKWPKVAKKMKSDSGAINNRIYDDNVQGRCGRPVKVPMPTFQAVFPRTTTCLSASTRPIAPAIFGKLPCHAWKITLLLEWNNLKSPERAVIYQLKSEINNLVFPQSKRAITLAAPRMCLPLFKIVVQSRFSELLIGFNRFAPNTHSRNVEASNSMVSHRNRNSIRPIRSNVRMPEASAFPSSSS